GILQAADRESRRGGLAGARLRRVRRGLHPHCARGERAPHPPSRAQHPPLPVAGHEVDAQRHPDAGQSVRLLSGGTMSAPLRLGVAGLGTVGANLLVTLAARGDRLAATLGRRVEVAGVCARSRSKMRAVDLEGTAWFDDARELARSPGIDVFVELIGGSDGVPKEAVEAALGAGKHVVTANKALLARHGLALARLAE